MRLSIFFSLALLAGRAAAAPFTLEAGVFYGDVSGARNYTVNHELRSRTSAVTIPTIRLAAAITESISVGFGYSHYGTLRSAGIVSRVPGGGGTPIEASERVQELALDARYRFVWTTRVGLEVGPVLSRFLSRAETRPMPGVPVRPGSALSEAQRTFDDEDFALGAVAAISYSISPRWVARASWRYASPFQRSVRHYGVSIGYLL